MGFDDDGESGREVIDGDATGSSYGSLLGYLFVSEFLYKALDVRRTTYGFYKSLVIETSEVMTSSQRKQRLINAH